MDYRVEFRALLHEGTRYGWLKTDCPNNKYVACTGRKAFENMTILSWCSKLTINKGFSDFKVRSFTFLPFRVTTAQKTESFESIFWLTKIKNRRNFNELLSLSPSPKLSLSYLFHVQFQYIKHDESWDKVISRRTLGCSSWLWSSGMNSKNIDRGTRR